MPGLSSGLNITTGLNLGGATSPMVAGAGVPGYSPSQAAGYGAGSTSGSGGGYLGTTPGHLTWYIGIASLLVLIAIRHSLPR